MDFLLDTNICIFHLRGKVDINRFRKAKNATIFISEISVLELYYGAENSINKEKSYLAVDSLLDEFKILSIENCSKKYAEIKKYLFKQGTPVHNEFDLLIGTTAIVNNLILVTDNFKDFKNIENLKLENWITR